MNEKIKKLEETIETMINRDGNVYFFTLDTKNAPNGEVKYIYDIALSLYNMGYKVTMLHQEEEFIGPIEWLGDSYSVLEHKNVKEENVVVTPSDFVFIPEVFSNVMGQTKSLPCKRIMIYYSPAYLTDYMPVGVTMSDLNIYDAITTNEALKAKLKGYFPNLNVRVVRPSINEIFTNNSEPKKLIVNLITPTANEVNDIVKPFYWKNPLYKWLSFRDLKGIPQPMLADVMREAAITVWVDDMTNNGQMALEALKSGSILIAKVPQVTPEWMVEDGEYRFGIIWVDSYDMLHDILASVVRGWTRDEIVEKYLTMSSEVENLYLLEYQKMDIEKQVIEDIFENTINTYRQILAAENNNVKNEE